MRKDFLPYYRPAIERVDIEAVAHSLESGWLTTGPKVRELEESFSKGSDVRHAVALNSGTAALHLALISLGVGRGDEVITPSLSFVAGTHCVRQLGAVPVFADVGKETLCLTPATIDAVVTPRTKAIITMNYGGQPVGIEAIVEYARQRHIAVLEDAAHAVGTLDSGLWAGARSDAAAFSLYATKNITAGEGGLLLTNRDDIAERVRRLSLHGMSRDAWKRYENGGTWLYDVAEVGYKCNMPDMAAALAISQLKKLEPLQAKREALAQAYIEKLSIVPGVRMVTSVASYPSRNSWCLFVISIDQNTTQISRDELIEELARANIGTSVHFIPTHTFSAYKHVEHGPLPVTDRVWRTLISLPLYPSMSEQDVADVVEALSGIIEQAQKRPSPRRSVNA